MRMKRAWLIGSFGLSLLLGPTPVSAGWVIELISHNGGHTNKLQMTFQDNKMKSVTFGEKGSPENAVIFDVEAQTMTNIDYGRKQVMVGSTTDFKKMMEGAQSAMAKARKQMEAQMKNMPPEQRLMMEQMMKERMPAMAAQPQDCPEPPKTEIRATGDQETIAGFATSGYDVLENGQLKSQVWIAEDIAIRDEFDIAKMQQLAETMASTQPCQTRQQGGGFQNKGVWELTKQGFPARIVDKKGSDKTEIVSAERQTVAAEEFIAPKGFQTQSMKQMMKEGFPQ